MQIVSIGDNLHGISNSFPGKNKKKIFQNIVLSDSPECAGMIILWIWYRELHLVTNLSQRFLRIALLETGRQVSNTNYTSSCKKKTTTCRINNKESGQILYIYRVMLGCDAILEPVRTINITKTRLFKYIEKYTTKKTESFQIKILIFFIFLLKT